MNLNKFVILSTTILLCSPLVSADQPLDESKPPPEFFTLPAGVDIEALPEPILEDPPVYLDVDSKGNVYRLSVELEKSGTYSSTYELVTEQELTELQSHRDVILQNMEEISLPGESTGLEGSAESSSSCTLPGAFTIWADANGNAMGAQEVANTNRPAGVTTQWLIYDFYTIDYRGAGSHMPTGLFHEDNFHAWGTFIGDNHESYLPDGTPLHCGTNALFNSQIEGWIQYDPEPADEDKPTPNWQNSVYNGPNSCGNEMYDGPVYYETLPFARYRMEMHASTGHWVGYRIFEFKTNPLRWVELTSWKTLDTDLGGTWSFTPPNYNDAAQGIKMAATNSSKAGNWSIVVSSTECGWF